MPANTPTAAIPPAESLKPYTPTATKEKWRRDSLLLRSYRRCETESCEYIAPLITLHKLEKRPRGRLVGRSVDDDRGLLEWRVQVFRNLPALPALHAFHQR